MGLKHAARKVNDQVFMVHYNVAGSNGKNAWFGLVKKAYGELFMDWWPRQLTTRVRRMSEHQRDVCGVVHGAVFKD